VQSREVSAERIAGASGLIDPVFLDSPLLSLTSLDPLLGCRASFKVETLNPIRSFKGRGTELFTAQLVERVNLVCGSAGNFGQGLARAGAQRKIGVTVFASESASSLKLAAMRALGADVRVAGHDFDAAKALARAYADASGSLYVEDGAWPEIAEGAGTIAREITEAADPPDVMIIPVGNGSLLTGIGTWMRHAAPATRVVGVVAAGAPSMRLSFEAGNSVATPEADTIADGIAVREPVPYSVAAMSNVADEILEVDDDALIKAMRLIHEHLGLVVEPAGAAGVAGVIVHGERWGDSGVRTILAGGNMTSGQMRRWLVPA